MARRKVVIFPDLAGGPTASRKRTLAQSPWARRSVHVGGGNAEERIASVRRFTGSPFEGMMRANERCF